MQSKLLITFINAVCISLCAWMLAQLSWATVAYMTPLDNAPTLDHALSTSDNRGNASTSNTLTQLKSAQLFGTASETNIKTPVKTPTVPLKVTTLNLRLNGILTSGTGAKVAIISYQGKQRAYAVGEQIQIQSAKLPILDILHDHIIISRNGIDEIVKLSKRQPLSRGLTRSAQERSALRADLNHAAYRQLIGNAKQTLQNRPLSLTKYFSVQPVNQHGSLQGYKLNAGSDGRLFQQLRLQENDLLTAVNGQPVTQLTLQSFSALLKQNAELELTLLRDSQPLSFTVSF